MFDSFHFSEFALSFNLYAFPSESDAWDGFWHSIVQLSDSEVYSEFNQALKLNSVKVLRR